MIERIWSGQSALYLLLLPLSGLYGLITLGLRFCYQRGWKKSWRAPVPVVVVGNLTAGGNGKTPVVIWLVENLQCRGLRVGVASRGYGGKADAYPMILDSHITTAQAGDEPVLIFQRTGAPVAVSPNRCQAVKALLQHTDIDLIITDDGLQHYALQRDFEIVVIDAVRRFGNGHWLPAGPMRERASRLNSIDAVIVNGNGQGQGSEIGMALQPGDAVNLLTGQCLPVNLLSDVIAMAGIGYPPRFFATLHRVGVKVLREVAFVDHQVYQAAALKALAAEEQTLLMTEKDAVKCRSFAQANWWYLPVNALLAEPKASTLLERLHNLAVADQRARR